MRKQTESCKKGYVRKSRIEIVEMENDYGEYIIQLN